MKNTKKLIKLAEDFEKTYFGDVSTLEKTIPPRWQDVVWDSVKVLEKGLKEAEAYLKSLPEGSMKEQSSIHTDIYHYKTLIAKILQMTSLDG